MSPQQLNTDLWSFDGSGFSANGIQFFAHRPVLLETVASSRPLTATAAGTWNTVAGSQTTAFSCLDTSALFGIGADNPGVYAGFTFGANVSGGAGVAGTAGTGGWYFAAAYLTASAAATTPAAAGSGMFLAQVFTPYDTVVGGNSPLAWWELADEAGTTTIADSSGNNRTGTATNVVFGDTNEAVLGYTSAAFGSTSTVLTTFNPGLSAVTVEGWVNLNGEAQTAAAPVVMASSQTSADHRGFELQMSGTTPQVLFGNGGTTATVTASAALPASGWTYLAGTYGGGIATLYVNGTASGTAALTGNMASGTASGIGIGYNPGSGSAQTAGLLAQCAIYGAALTSSQVFAHYQSGLNGVALFNEGGTTQPAGTAQTGCSYYVDLVNAGPGTVNTWQPAVFVADASASTRTPPADGTDTSGLTSRVTWAWAGVAAGGSTVTAVPAPQQTWTSAITSAQLNGPSGPVQATTFLNNPPLLKVTQPLSATVPSATQTSLSWGSAATLDTYGGWTASPGVYTAPLPGLYLAAPLACFTPAAAGQRYAGLSVNGTAVTLQGPAVASAGAAIVSCAGQVRVLDLAAGDTVGMWCGQNSGSPLTLAGTAATTRMMMAYLCPYSAGGVAAATPPYTPFRWQAGFTAARMPSLLSEHLGNDLSFLVNRPYFTGYQGTAQSGFVNGTWNAVTIDTPGGIIHGSYGDNYAGWSASLNAYVAQQPGWYLCLLEGFATVPTAATGYLTAGFSVPASGGVPPLTSPDWYQSMYYPLTTGSPPGVSAIGTYYLQAGESVQPLLNAKNWGGTWGTYSSASARSQFSAVWLCE